MLYTETMTYRPMQITGMMKGSTSEKKKTTPKTRLTEDFAVPHKMNDRDF